MNLVLYSTVDLAPITILPVPMWAVEMLKARSRVRFAVQSPISAFSSVDSSIEHCEIKTVEVFAEPIQRGNVKTIMLLTDMEENALLLKPGYLPGQQRDVKMRVEGAFLRGLLTALGGEP